MKYLVLIASVLCLAAIWTFSAARPETTPELETQSLGRDLPSIRVIKGTKLLRSTTEEFLSAAEPPCVTPDGIWGPISVTHSGSQTNFNATLDLSTPQSVLPCYVDITARAEYSDSAVAYSNPIRIHVVSLPYCNSGAYPGNPPRCVCRNGYRGNSGKCR